jgi:prepilin-type N-terminal cleavage/methylation domain-containing protein
LCGRGDRRSGLGRGGFSLVETVLVLVILAVVAAYVVPSLGASTDTKSVRGAANVINAQLSSARTVAIMRGRCATVHLAGNVIWTTTATCGAAPIDTVTRQNLATAFGVVAQGCAGTYCDPGNSVDYVFDPRGIPYSGQPGTWVVSRNAAADTVEVGLMGVVSE